jgi:hypothetical protein
LPDLHAQRLGNLDEIESGDVPFAALDSAIIGPVNVSKTGKPLLREILLFAQAADLSAERNELLAFHGANRLSASGFLFHGL